MTRTPGNSDKPAQFCHPERGAKDPLERPGDASLAVQPGLVGVVGRAFGPRPEDDPQTAIHPGELITFKLGQEHYALPLAEVREVLPRAAMAPLLAAPAGFAGLLRLRGELLPVVDLRQCLGFPATAPRIGQCIMVTSLASHAAGLLVDSVHDITPACSSRDPGQGAGSEGVVREVLQTAAGDVVAVLNATVAVGQDISRFLGLVSRDRTVLGRSGANGAEA